MQNIPSYQSSFSFSPGCLLIPSPHCLDTCSGHSGISIAKKNYFEYSIISRPPKSSVFCFDYDKSCTNSQFSDSLS